MVTGNLFCRLANKLPSVHKGNEYFHRPSYCEQNCSISYCNLAIKNREVFVTLFIRFGFIYLTLQTNIKYNIQDLQRFYCIKSFFFLIIHEGIQNLYAKAKFYFHKKFVFHREVR